jgi:site-specific DNA-methyltransferase (adenine-specific)
MLEPNQIYCGDCLELLKEMPDNSVDSVVTDPPAGIAFMGKEWDKDKGGRDKWIAWMCEIAKECNRVLKPGGHALVWAIPRTSHWTATAWEDAGFEVRDRIAHAFGSGFPKSHNIGVAVDKLQGNEREVVGKSNINIYRGDGDSNYTMAENATSKKSGYEKSDITKGNSPWEGWGTALKPAIEDWWLLRKPISEKNVAENVLRWSTGGLNIDGCRVGIPEGDDSGWSGSKAWNKDSTFTKKGKCTSREKPQGRFPSHLIHDGSDEVVGLFPESKSSIGARNPNGKTKDNKLVYGDYKAQPGVMSGHNDKGSAARFFYCAKPSKRERNIGLEGFEEKFSPTMNNGIGGKEHDPQTATKKANHHPTVKPIALMEYLVKMITPKCGIVLDPFAGSGSTLIAAKQNGFDFIGIDLTPEYVKIAKARLESVTKSII